MKPENIRIANKNNIYQHMEVIKRNRKKRSHHGEFFIEGVKPINFAIKYGIEISSFAYAFDKPLSDWANDILRQNIADMHVSMPYHLLSDLSEKDENISELIAIAKIPDDDLKRIKISSDMVTVVFDRPSNYGNLGSLIRTMEGFASNGLIITGHGADIYDSRVVRASMGTIFAVPTVRLPSYKDVAIWADEIKKSYPDLKIIGTTSKGAVPIHEVDLKGPVIILIGNETFGLSANYKQMWDVAAKIPMQGDITSLNVSCAASIILYEVYRQRAEINNPYR